MNKMIDKTKLNEALAKLHSYQMLNAKIHQVPNSRIKVMDLEPAYWTFVK